MSRRLAKEARARDFSVIESLEMSAALQRPTADCSHAALRRLACVAHLDGLRARHPSFPRRRRQGQHDDPDRLARHHAGDRRADDRRDPRFRMVVPGVQHESALSARLGLFRPDRAGRLVDPAADDHAPGRRGLDRLARARSGKAAAVRRTPLEVQVVSLDWKWLFIYPDQGVASVNQLVVPAGVPMHFSLTSASVMNAFFVPQLGSMIYTMNGMATQLNLQADEPGTFRGLSSHFSGDGFSDMHFDVVALPADGSPPGSTRRAKAPPQLSPRKPTRIWPGRA